jgi:hypothetical protein
VSTVDESPFPPASVARLSKTATGKKSAVLVARSMQYLFVRVLFHGVPMPGLKVQLGQIDDIDDKSPQKMEPQLTTDENGIACFPRLVVAGIYSCEVERQPMTVVPTVGNLQEPYPIVLPIGRPVVDVYDIDEFAERPAQTDVGAGAVTADTRAEASEGGSDEVHVIALQLSAIGDTPLIHHPVRVLDPDTGEAVAEATTDEEGVLRVQVPADKNYRIELVDDDADHPAPPRPAEDEAATLLCLFVDAQGNPLANEAIEASIDDERFELHTDTEGKLESPARLAEYELKARGQVFTAHALPLEVAKPEHTYRFVVAAEAAS